MLGSKDKFFVDFWLESKLLSWFLLSDTNVFLLTVLSDPVKRREYDSNRLLYVQDDNLNVLPPSLSLAYKSSSLAGRKWMYIHLKVEWLVKKKKWHSSSFYFNFRSILTTSRAWYWLAMAWGWDIQYFEQFHTSIFLTMSQRIHCAERFLECLT